MTKAELIEMLSEYSDDTLIYISSDQEGNSLNSLSAHGVIMTNDPDSYNLEDSHTYGPDDEDYIKELLDNGIDLSDYTKVVILYP